MTYYKDSTELYGVLEVLFTRINEDDSQAAHAVSKSKLTIQLVLTDPDAELFIDGKHNPVTITYGKTTKRPILFVTLPSIIFHKIMMRQISMKDVASSGKLKVRGPFWKAFILEDIFRKGQEIYPDVTKSLGFST
jgi:alkyl sulfatase BDS1-like metallo-beta-lactamase superfamily hydrolase